MYFKLLFPLSQGFSNIHQSQNSRMLKPKMTPMYFKLLFPLSQGFSICFIWRCCCHCWCIVIPTPFWAHLILGTLMKVTVKHSQQQGGYPLVAEMMMIRRMTATTTPMIAIIFMFCHQYFLFSRVA